MTLHFFYKAIEILVYFFGCLCSIEVLDCLCLWHAVVLSFTLYVNRTNKDHSLNLQILWIDCLMKMMLPVVKCQNLK